MLKKVNKRIAILLLICMTFVTLSPGFVHAKSASSVQLIETEIKQSANPGQNSVIKPAMAPGVGAFISTLMTRLGPWLQRLGIQISVSYHFAQKAIERGISAVTAARVLMFGKKAIDNDTGARVIYHSGLQIAIIIDKTSNTLVTIYQGPFKSWRWVYRNWSW